MWLLFFACIPENIRFSPINEIRAFSQRVFKALHTKAAIAVFVGTFADEQSISICSQIEGEDSRGQKVALFESMRNACEKQSFQFKTDQLDLIHFHTLLYAIHASIENDNIEYATKYIEANRRTKALLEGYCLKYNQLKLVSVFAEYNGLRQGRPIKRRATVFSMNCPQKNDT